MIHKFVLKKIDKFLRNRSIASISPQEIYNTTIDYWTRLNDFFQKTGPKSPPSLAILPYYNQANLSTTYLPKKPEGITIPRETGTAIYFPQHHLIMLDSYFITKKELPAILVHETTHSATIVKNPIVNITLDDLIEFDGNIKKFGKLLHRTSKSLLNRYGEQNLTVSLPEFLTPLGETHILGNFMKINWRLNLIFTDLTHILENPLNAGEGLISLINHLPELAGELLVTQYKKDLTALFRDHPNLLKLNGPQLWNQYCVPLLKNGKL